MTEIINEWPPNISAIKKVLPATERNIFAYGGIIYNPGGGVLPPELIAHEEVHFGQQTAIGGPKRWWKRFLKDPEFRLEQELEAHKVEHRVYCQNHKDRNLRSRHLQVLGARLAKPMYGGLIGAREAMVRIAR